MLAAALSPARWVEPSAKQGPPVPRQLPQIYVAMRVCKPRFFRPRSEAVQAVQWRPGRRPAGVILERPPGPGTAALLPWPAHALLGTQWGRVTVFAGDWIVTGPTGQRQVVPNKYFGQHYLALKGRRNVFVPRATRAE